MDMYNSDGTQAEMCGNATRCVGKYVHDRGLTDKTTITLETLAGIKILNLNLNENNEVDSVCVNMGSPELVPEKIPVNSKLDRFIQEDIIVDEKEYKVTCVSMGNPHAVTFVDDVNKITATFASSPGCNVNAPILNQLLAPFLAFVNSTAISNIIDIP